MKKRNRVKLNTSISQETYEGLEHLASLFLKPDKNGFWRKTKASKGRAIDWLVAKELANNKA
jgi:hypothetical protein